MSDLRSVAVATEYLVKSGSDMLKPASGHPGNPTPAETAQENLKALGQEDWDLAAIAPELGGSGVALWVFKRPATAERGTARFIALKDA